MVINDMRETTKIETIENEREEIVNIELREITEEEEEEEDTNDRLVIPCLYLNAIAVKILVCIFLSVGVLSLCLVLLFKGLVEIDRGGEISVLGKVSMLMSVFFIVCFYGAFLCLPCLERVHGYFFLG